MKKLIAGFLTALTALLTVASPALAATQLGSYPGMLAAADGTLDAYVVVGSGGSDPAGLASDIAGAINIAVRLAEVGKTTKTETCAGTSGAVTGTEKDSVALYGSTSISDTFPAGGVLKSAHYSSLKDGTYAWHTDDYDYREQVDISGVAMSNSLATSGINGTETMVVESSDMKYQYVFEEQLAGTGSVATPNYTYPVNIQMLGKAFSIVGCTANQVKMLKGSIGTATATSGVVYGTYTAYSDLGSNAAWARVQIKDSTGNTVDTLIINSGESKSSSATGLTLQVTQVRALQDGTVVGTDLVVGPTTEGVVKTYDITADTTSTGTASDRFTGETDWGIEVVSGFCDVVDGRIDVDDIIQVIYKPSSTQYIKAGGKASLPNSYGDLGFEGWNTDKFATITIKPVGGTISAYNKSADTQVFGNLNGLEISSDVGGSIINRANEGFSKAYILWNYSVNADNVPVSIGFYDSSKSKILINGTWEAANSGDANEYSSTQASYYSKRLNITAGYALDNMTYSFKLSYSNAGDQAFYLNVTLGGNTLIRTITAGTSALQNVNMSYFNKTSVTTSQAPDFRLGATAASTETTEVTTKTAGSSSFESAGKNSQEVVADSGLLLQDTTTNGAADKVVFKVPFKDLKAKVYFGKLGGVNTTAGSVSYTNYPAVPITSAVAKLDTEVTATEKLKNLITVGGPCVNKVTADAMGLTYPTCGVASTIPTDKGLIKVIDDKFTTGQVVIVVAGWAATNTKTAASVLQQYDTLLVGQTASAVQVTSATSAGITAA
jgi:hypothetical protein